MKNKLFHENVVVCVLLINICLVLCRMLSCVLCWRFELVLVQRILFGCHVNICDYAIQLMKSPQWNMHTVYVSDNKIQMTSKQPFNIRCVMTHRKSGQTNKRDEREEERQKNIMYICIDMYEHSLYKCICMSGSGWLVSKTFTSWKLIHCHKPTKSTQKQKHHHLPAIILKAYSVRMMLKHYALYNALFAQHSFVCSFVGWLALASGNTIKQTVRWDEDETG